MELCGKLVGLYGYPGSGKDAVAEFLVEKGGWTRVAFADPLKAMLVALDPYVELDGDGYCGEGDTWQVRLSRYMANECCDLEGAKRKCPEVRRLLQRLGTEAGRDILGEDVWVKAAAVRVHELLKTSNVVMTDVRFPNEADFIQGVGTLVEVMRPGCVPMEHASEQHYGTFEPDYIIFNDGTLDALRSEVDQFLFEQFAVAPAMDNTR
jgi:hypothetical protein